MIKEQTQYYNLDWSVKGMTDRSAVPLGNGETGISLWVEDNGDLQFYIARTDAQTEQDRNVKLGKVRLSFEPNPFATGEPFFQTLDLWNGCVDITAGGEACAHIKVFVSKLSDTIYVEGNFSVPTFVTATYQNWRVKEEDNREEQKRFYLTFDSAEDHNFGESNDIIEQREGGLLFYHRNEQCIIETSAKLQALNGYENLIQDTLKNRIFGGYMTLSDGEIIHPNRLKSKAAVSEVMLEITTESYQTPDLEAWAQNLIQEHKAREPFSVVHAATSKWWQDYFEHSYIFVEGDVAICPEIPEEIISLCREPMGAHESQKKSQVTRAYILTKYMNACSAYGNFPILFNGALFNLTPTEHIQLTNFAKVFTGQPLEPTPELNPDERAWGHFNLWQNQRLPYHSMLARGETTSMKSLFSYYRRFWEINRVKAEKYYNASGQYNTEITTSFGLMPNGLYGYDRANKPDGFVDNRWGGAVDISPGLELVSLMLDYYDFTGDDCFLENEILVYAKDLLLYIETRFKERKEGKLVLAPLHCVETYWDTTNPITVVVGLHMVVERILDLPKHKVKAYDYFKVIHTMIPEIALKQIKGKTVVKPAEVYEDKPNNVEPVELYTIFPFRYFGIGKANEQIALDTFHASLEFSQTFKPFSIGESPRYKSFSGWQYQGMAAALMGLTEDAKTVLTHNCGLHNPGNRFPAMWGPIYDAVPDTDHGANILNILQRMIMQVEGDKIYLLPAWPKDWNVRFKLYVDVNTTIECDYRQGRLDRLEVIPQERMKDIVRCV